MSSDLLLNGERRLLMLAYYFPPQNTSGAARPSRFAKYLKRLGYSLRVISLATEDQGEANGWVSAVPLARPARSATHRASQFAYFVERAVLPYNERLPWVPHAIEEGRRIHREWPYSVVLSTSPPIATHLAALRLKREFGLRWIADLRDPICGNPFRRRKIGYLYDKALQRLIFENADALIANTDVVAETWRREYPRLRNKISVIWNGFDPEEKVPARIENQPHVRRTLLHTGSLYRGRHPNLLLSAVQRLIDRQLLDPGCLRIELVGPWKQRLCVLSRRLFSLAASTTTD